jgi:3-oxoacyl-[acyl-carrier protein] reductase
MDDYLDKVVLVTGAGRGVGRELALAFARQGACVAANDLTPINLDETMRLARAELVPTQYAKIQDFLVDVSQKMAVQGMIIDILDRWGRLDIVINNAAVRAKVPLLDMDEWDWRRVLDVNLTGAFIVTQVAGRVMREQGGGVILNITEALQDLPGSIPVAAYQASKAGLAELTRQSARELKEHSVRVNAIAPGLLATESTTELYPKGIVMGESNTTTVEELPGPVRVSDLALFLGSPAAGDITGQIWSLEPGGV